MFKTRIIDKLGIKYPIIQGAMLWMSKAGLVAAVSNVGGLGILSSATFFTKEAFGQEVRNVRSLINKPFAVNLVYLPVNRDKPTDDFVDIILEEGVKVVETVGPIQTSLTEKLHKAKNICSHKVTSVRNALAAERSSVEGRYPFIL